jgi:hypothetical protein
MRAIAESQVPDFTDCHEYFIMIQQLLSEHNSFITIAGRIGLGPPKARPSDCVCILQWGDVPFILRGNKQRQAINANSWEMITCTGLWMENSQIK